MNACLTMFCTTRFVSRPLALLRGRVEGLAFVLALVCALIAPSAVRAQCPAVWVPGVGVPGIGSGSVRALAVLPGGDVIVGGSFSTAGGVAVNNIAWYN
jgi:hypothetical protein